MKQIFLGFILLFIFYGCTAHGPQTAKIEQLQMTLVNLDVKVDFSEAATLATNLHMLGASLALEYALVKPPLFHNFLVNAGVKKRGLCWHFATDMLESVLKEKYESFDFYLVGTNIGDYWQEHTALLVTAQGQEVSKGVIIDAWRNSGELFFSKIDEDPVYKWSQRGAKRNER
ncbi:MAG: hypothetical protein IBX44_06895 [Sulfurospirillum sp.]|nr:hypothetical protein [Sulfurospirillum sp.]